MNKNSLLALFGISVAVVMYGCTAEAPTGSEGAIAFAKKGPAPKIEICHYSEETGTYHMINVSANAESAHRAHGDGQVGEPVPGLEGFEFDQNCVPTPVCLAPPEGMVSWWSGDVDASDIHNGNHGTLLNGASAGVPGKVDGAFRFDGFDDYVEVPDAASLNITGALTIDAWIRLDEVGIGWQVILIKDSETDLGKYHTYQLEVAGSKLFFALGDGGPTPYWAVVSNSTLEANTWYHIAAVYDGIHIMLYVNGALDATAQGPTKPLHTHNKALKIGRTRQHNTWYYPFHGLMDEVELFNRSLSAEEIQAIYNAGSYGKCKPPR